ncbi:dihydrodipicolinate synthase family protein [Acidisoma silvae]|uniref:Dihydrodipicolinate synthase family protein n=1 Tax=Acidisoma silvae TaxID=2802396 RepID=A0A963YR79_9PROT|nr:dihydrodipicolinate synthase family protein [Acidisoma silvae]MCB8875361.1 dihydrodipicolinate synthase family protein [Acidisoma silvae]
MSVLLDYNRVYTALVTPFRDGRIDEEAFQILCDKQLEARTDLVIGSDIGEGLSLGESELLRLVEIANDTSRRRSLVLAYLDFSMHRQTDDLAQLLIRGGADALICRLPHSSSFGPEEAQSCIRRVSHAIDRPVFVEHGDALLRPHISEDMIESLFRSDLIYGLVLNHLDPIRFSRRQSILGETFVQLIADDRLAACHIAAGGQGWISPIGNVAPRACAQLVSTWNLSDVGQFRTIRDVLISSSCALNAVHPSVGLKAILKKSGIADGSVRAPLRCLHQTAESTLLHAVAALQNLDRAARRGRD